MPVNSTVASSSMTHLRLIMVAKLKTLGFPMELEIIEMSGLRVESANGLADVSTKLQ